VENITTKMKRIFTIVFICLVSFSCKKTTVDKQLSTLELLSGTKSKTWIGSAASVKLLTTNTTYDLFQLLPACETDDIMTIYPTKIVENKEGLTKCDSKGSDIKNSSKWTLNADEKSITVENFVVSISPTEKLTFANQVLKILEVNVSSLKLEGQIKYRSQEAIITASFVAK
jgi:hypothetical protein